jgi:DNA repair protein RadA/Sms
MTKARTLYVCQGCGHRSPRWLGRCPECDAWDSFSEEMATVAPRPGKAGAPPAGTVVPLAAVEDEAVVRFASGLPALDRVLGGGVVAGAAVLVAGEPGIGKSTLLLQAADALATSGRKVLYVSAEESPRQLRLRAERLGCLRAIDPAATRPGVLVAGESTLEVILAAAEHERPDVLLVDSIQALRGLGLESPAGSIGQVRHAADRLVELAKRREIALFLVGHVTKEGAIAGPKSLEHLVDTVLAFEGEHASDYRILRAGKNRFGPTGEIAIFAMHDSGLVPVADPSRALLERRRADAPGSAVAVTLQGSRPLLVEIQALVSPTSFPAPRRMAVGLDANRVTLLVAVLDRFGGVQLGDRDLFLNVVGGLALREPAIDLAVAAAVLSAVRGTPLPPDAVFFGELGLLGEVRPVSQAEGRLREAAHLGFKRAFAPRAGSSQTATRGAGSARGGGPGVTLVAVDDLADLAGRLLGVR